MNVFDRVVCGVDRSAAGLAAARVAARVADPQGELVLISVDDGSPAVHAGRAGADVLTEPAEDAEEALDRAAAAVAPVRAVETRLVTGNRLDEFLGELARREATLAVVGTHERPRAVGIALGSLTTHVVHEAGCSVLVARAPRSERWPRTIVAGVDGSPPSIVGAAVARGLARRLGASVRFVTATADDRIDVENARAVVPELEERDGRAVDELHVLSEFADLLVVGSRGLRGIRALGSVSERVAHEARSSVLVVRGYVSDCCSSRPCSSA